MKFLSKFRENVGLQAYHLGSVLNRSWTGLFRSFSKKLRGPGLLVRLNRLQSGPVLGPFPVLRTGPWSTNPRVWDPWRVEGGSVTTFHLSFLAPNMLSPHFSAATAQSVAPYVHHIFPSPSPRLYHEPSSINSMYNCNQILSRPLIGTNPYYLNLLSKTKLWTTDYYSWRVVWSCNKYAVILCWHMWTWTCPQRWSSRSTSVNKQHHQPHHHANNNHSIWTAVQQWQDNKERWKWKL